MMNRLLALALALALPGAARSAPVLVYSTPTQDGWNGWHEDVAADAAGNVYRVATPYDGTRAWVELQKLDPAGRLVSSRPLDPAIYRVTAIAVDALGRIHVGGWTNPGFATTPDAAATTAQGGFYARLSADGATEYATFVPLEPNGIATDAAGGAYLAGSAQYDAVTLPLATTPDAVRSAPAAGVYMRLDPAGRIAYATFLGGSGNADYAYSVAIAPSGDVFVAGRTTSTDFPVKNALQPALPGLAAAYVAKFGPANDLQWATYLGGTTGGPYGPSTLAYDVAVGPDGAPVVVGVTSATDFPLVSASQTYGQYSPGFVTKLAADGQSLVYSTLFGEGGAVAVAVDGRGVAHVTGRASSWVPGFQSIGFPIPWYDEHQFVARFDPAGGLAFSTLVGGDWDETPFALAVDGIGSTIALGRTRSQNFPYVRAPQGPWPSAYVVKIGVGLPGAAQAQGWFASPAGAYAADPALATKADLQVRASLDPAAGTPTGEVRFSVRGTPLAFTTGVPDAFVALGRTVEIHGSANDASGQPLGFLVSLLDAASGPDLVRVKVWSAASGAVLYESQPAAAGEPPPAPWAAPTTAFSGGQVAVTGT